MAVTLESWLLAHGDIVWKSLLVGFVMTGSLTLPLWARRRRHQQNLHRLGLLYAPWVNTPDPGLVGRSVVVHGTLQARQPGKAASTLGRFAGDPLAMHAQSGPLAVKMGASTLVIHGPVEVRAGSGTTTRRSTVSNALLEYASVAHGDTVAAYGVLERVPGARFEGYRQDAGTWRLAPGPGDDHVRIFFAGRPRAPWLRWGAMGASVMAAVFFVMTWLVGYVAIAHPSLTVRCHGLQVSVPAASALASATPAFRDWGIRRHAMYEQCMREAAQGTESSGPRPP